MKNMIFISHRSTDKEIADMLFDFFVACGVERENVFCSSLPGNDVVKEISKEVKEAIQNSSINIAILSKSYQESPYCLNEAGILWFSDTPVVVIGMPEINAENMKMFGFLNAEYKLRRLDNSNDISAICDEVCEKTGSAYPKSSVVTKENQKLIGKYTKCLENRESMKLVNTSASKLDLNSCSFSFEYSSSDSMDTYEEKSVTLLELFTCISMEMLTVSVTENKIEETIKRQFFSNRKKVNFKNAQVIKNILCKFKALNLVETVSNGFSVYWKLTEQGEIMQNEIALCL